jgi:predicted DNA-binding protein with PD1-like motif
MVIQNLSIQRIIGVRLNPGDDLLLSLRQAVEEQGIRSGVILCGIGSLSAYRVHVVETTRLPPGDVFFSEEGPFDILQVNGYVLEGRVHAHLTLSNTEKAMGGHLEEGCKVLTFAVLTLAETDADLTGWDRVGPLS